MNNVSNPLDSLLLRGSTVLVRRKCGKTQCRCAQGELHQTWALSYSYQGRTKMIPLRKEDLPSVRAAILNYKKASDLLEKQALQGIKFLHATIKAAKRGKR